jgi:hypothetical protein
MGCAARLEKLASLHIPSLPKSQVPWNALASALVPSIGTHHVVPLVVHEMNVSVCPYDEAVSLNFGKSTTSTSAWTRHGHGGGVLSLRRGAIGDTCVQFTLIHVSDSAE